MLLLDLAHDLYRDQGC